MNIRLDELSIELEEINNEIRSIDGELNNFRGIHNEDTLVGIIANGLEKERLKERKDYLISQRKDILLDLFTCLDESLEDLNALKFHLRGLLLFDVGYYNVSDLKEQLLEVAMRIDNLREYFITLKTSYPAIYNDYKEEETIYESEPREDLIERDFIPLEEALKEEGESLDFGNNEWVKFGGFDEDNLLGEDLQDKDLFNLDADRTKEKLDKGIKLANKLVDKLVDKVPEVLSEAKDKVSSKLNKDNVDLRKEKIEIMTDDLANKISDILGDIDFSAVLGKGDKIYFDTETREEEDLEEDLEEDNLSEYLEEDLTGEQEGFFGDFIKLSDIFGRGCNCDDCNCEEDLFEDNSGNCLGNTEDNFNCMCKYHHDEEINKEDIEHLSLVLVDNLNRYTKLSSIDKLLVSLLLKGVITEDLYGHISDKLVTYYEMLDDLEEDGEPMSVIGLSEQEFCIDILNELSLDYNICLTDLKDVCSYDLDDSSLQGIKEYLKEEDFRVGYFLKEITIGNNITLNVIDTELI